MEKEFAEYKNITAVRLKEIHEAHLVDVNARVAEVSSLQRNLQSAHRNMETCAREMAQARHQTRAVEEKRDAVVVEMRENTRQVFVVVL